MTNTNKKEKEQVIKQKNRTLVINKMQDPATGKVVTYTGVYFSSGYYVLLRDGVVVAKQS